MSNLSDVESNDSLAKELRFFIPVILTSSLYCYYSVLVDSDDPIAIFLLPEYDSTLAERPAIDYGLISSEDEAEVGNASVESDVEIVEADDDTVSLPAELPGEPAEASKDHKGLKREHEGEEILESCKKKKNDSDDEDDGKLCPICLDMWSSDGEHRVCSLKCGHLFGHSCLQRWLDGHVAKDRTCPTCKHKVCKKDIRFIYVKRLIALDTSEVEDLKRNLLLVKAEKKKLQSDLNRMHLKKTAMVAALQEEIDALTVKYRSVIFPLSRSPGVVALQCCMDKSREVNPQGGCRVLDYHARSSTMCISTRSPNQLFAGFGIRMVSMPDCRFKGFVPTNMKPIRDLAVGYERLLSVSLDTKAKITDMVSQQEVASFGCENPLWSCCWDAGNSNVFYTGDGRGSVCAYDLRNPREEFAQIQTPGDQSPVVSLACTQFQPGGPMPLGGLLCCKLNSCWALEKTQMDGATYDSWPLSLDGPFMSLRYDQQTRMLLVSARPNQRVAHSRHTVCTLAQEAAGEPLQCPVVCSFVGSRTQSLMTRSSMFRVAGQQYVAAHSQADGNVTIWSVGSGNRVGSVPAHSPVLDSYCVQCDDVSYLTTLNEKKLDLFKIL